MRWFLTPNPLISSGLALMSARIRCVCHAVGDAARAMPGVFDHLLANETRVHRDSAALSLLSVLAGASRSSAVLLVCHAVGH